MQQARKILSAHLSVYGWALASYPVGLATSRAGRRCPRIGDAGCWTFRLLGRVFETRSALVDGGRPVRNDLVLTRGSQGRSRRRRTRLSGPALRIPGGAGTWRAGPPANVLVIAGPRNARMVIRTARKIARKVFRTLARFERTRQMARRRPPVTPVLSRRSKIWPRLSPGANRARFAQRHTGAALPAHCSSDGRLRPGDNVGPARQARSPGGAGTIDPRRRQPGRPGRGRRGRHAPVRRPRRHSASRA